MEFFKNRFKKFQIFFAKFSNQSGQVIIPAKSLLLKSFVLVSLYMNLFRFPSFFKATSLSSQICWLFDFFIYFLTFFCLLHAHVLLCALRTITTTATTISNNTENITLLTSSFWCIGCLPECQFACLPACLTYEQTLDLGACLTNASWLYVIHITFKPVFYLLLLLTVREMVVVVMYISLA